MLKFQDGPLGSTSQAPGQNNSVMDSSKHGQSKSEFMGETQQNNQDNKSEMTDGGDNADLQENFFKVKNVFDILIEEASYLIDDRAIK